MSGLFIERKRDFHLKRWFFLIIFVSALGTTGWYTYKWFTTGEQPPVVPLPAAALANPDVDESAVSKEDIDNYKTPKTEPRYISIPSIGVLTARVQLVDLSETRELELPKNIHDAGWYNGGAFPGQTYGVVMISGHCRGVTSNGIFTNLGELKIGAEIAVQRGDGKKFYYEVTENKTMPILEALKSGMEELATPKDPNVEELGIIACAGNWVPRDKVYDQRTIVRAVIK